MTLTQFYAEIATVEADLVLKTNELQMYEATLIDYDSRTAVEKQLLQKAVEDSVYNMLQLSVTQLKSRSKFLTQVKHGVEVVLGTDGDVEAFVTAVTLNYGKCEK